MTKFYPMAFEGSVRTRSARWFRLSGEMRAPKKGEYYLSGAIPEVYRAPNDLSTAYNIMIEVPAPPKTIMRDGFEYQLRS